MNVSTHDGRAGSEQQQKIRCNIKLTIHSMALDDYVSLLFRDYALSMYYCCVWKSKIEFSDSSFSGVLSTRNSLPFDMVKQTLFR